MTAVLTWARLLTLPVLAYVTYRDVRTRRVPRRIWVLLLGVALILLAASIVTASTPSARSQLIIITTASLVLALVLAVPMALSSSLGTADALAFITIALLFPTIPYLEAGGFSLPTTPSPPLFFLAVLSNTVLVTLAYPSLLLLGNLRHGQLSSRLLTGRPYAWTDVLNQYGRLFTPENRVVATGIDLDALRKYLQWRNATLAEIRADRTRYRHPDTVPTTTTTIGEGTVDTNQDLTGALDAPTGENDVHGDGGATLSETTAPTRDPWGAATFITSVDTDLYGATPNQLRTALDQLADASTQTVWVSPGIPLLLPLFIGLLLAIFVGDLRVALLAALYV